MDKSAAKSSKYDLMHIICLPLVAVGIGLSSFTNATEAQFNLRKKGLRRYMTPLDSLNKPYIEAYIY